MNKYYLKAFYGKLFLYCLFLVSNTQTLTAQTSFAGVNFSGIGDWENPANWTNGLPAPGNDANIGGGAVVTINDPLTLDFNVQSFGTLEVQADVNGTGNFNNFFGIINMDAGVMWTNNGTIDNRGTINVMANGSFTNGSSGIYTSDGSGNINVAATGAIINNGNMTNLATITLDGTFNNAGTFITQGTINTQSGGVFNNNSGNVNVQNGAVFNNGTGGQYNNAGGSANILGTFNNTGSFSNTSSFTNGAAFVNDGTFENQSGGTFNNNLNFTNNSSVTNTLGATFNNNQIYNNSGNTDNQGFFDNNNIINNLSGTFANATGASMENDLGSEVRNSATFTNNGTINSEGDLINDNTSGTATFTNNTTIITTENGQIVNADDFNNNGEINNLSLVSNTGTFVNAGTLTTNTTFTNDGLLQNLSTGMLTNELVLINNNVIQNSGMVNNGVRIFNNGTITNDGILSNIGDFNNNAPGIVNNNGTFDNNDGGILTNDGTVTNNSTLLNQNCSSVNNNGIINNADLFQNDGLLFQMGTLGGMDITGSGVVINGQNTGNLCQNIEISIGESGSTNILASAIADQSFLNCSSLTLLIDGEADATFTCSNLGENSAQLSIEDRLGNSASCTAIVTVIETTIPVISNCPQNINATADENGTAVVSWTEPTATDNCNLTTFVGSSAPGDAFPVGTTTVNYLATDGQGNTAFCSFDVIVAEFDPCDGETTAPVISNCPDNISATADASGFASVSWVEPTATDECGLLSFVGDAAPGDNFPVGTTTVTYTATDEAGNTATCSFNVVVEAAQGADCDNIHVLFVVGYFEFDDDDNELELEDGDEDIYERLRYVLGYQVTVANDDYVQTGDANGKDLIYISSTVLSSKVGSKFTNVNVPVVTSESYLFDDLKMTGNDTGDDYGEFCDTKKTQIIDSSNPIADGLSGVVKILSDEDCVRWGIPSNDAAIVSSLVNYPDCAMVFTYDTGDQMVGLSAPARRVGLFLTDETAEELNGKGWKLFDNSVKYALGCLDASSSNCTNTTLEIVLDRYPGETYWVLKNNYGSTIAYGGPYYGYSEGDVITESFCLPEGCYTYSIYDSYGDGICCSWGQGSFSLTNDSNGDVLASGGQFGWVDHDYFCISGASGLASTIEEDANARTRGDQATSALQLLDIEDLAIITESTFLNTSLTVYPNPTEGLTNVKLEGIKGETPVNILVTNITGSIVFEQRLSQADWSNFTLDLSNQQSGVYLVTAIAKGGIVLQQKLIVQTSKP